MITIRRQDYRGGHRYYVEGDDRIDPKKPLPSCTGIARHADNSGSNGLMHWAVNLFQDTGRRLEFQNSSARARDIGTLLHSEIEEYIANQQAPSDASALFGTWYSSVNENGVTFVTQEMLVYNPYLKYGGTLDAVGMVNGVPTLFDWKTTDEYKLKRDKLGRVGYDKKGHWWDVDDIRDYARAAEYGVVEQKKFDESVGNAVQLGGYMLALKAMAEKQKTLVPTQAYIVYVFKDTLKTKWVKVNLNRAEEVFTQASHLYNLMASQKTGGLYAV